jgi:hypothetical protein
LSAIEDWSNVGQIRCWDKNLYEQILVLIACHMTASSNSIILLISLFVLNAHTFLSFTSFKSSTFFTNIPRKASKLKSAKVEQPAFSFVDSFPPASCTSYFSKGSVRLRISGPGVKATSSDPDPGSNFSDLPTDTDDDRRYQQKETIRLGDTPFNQGLTIPDTFSQSPAPIDSGVDDLFSSPQPRRPRSTSSVRHPHGFLITIARHPQSGVYVLVDDCPV